jgi:hypothetical protein
MERELGRREHLVRELVASLEDAREGGANGVRFEAAPPVAYASPDEVARLRRKLDELAFEVARREGELVAQAWRIAELEASGSGAGRGTGEAASAPSGGASPPVAALEAELARVRDELDALRQALTQEHAARLAAESGEELARARAEIARQSVLLEQMRGSHA